MKAASRAYAPYIVAAIILLGFLAVGVATSSRCGGTWVFALDDPYIHLAMARNLVEHGTWGASPGEFSATSSSPLYTLLLAGGFLTGIESELWGWVFSALGGVIAAFLLTWRIQRSFPKPGAAVGLGSAACLAIWLPETMASGMEHTLHISAVLIVILLFEQIMSEAAEKHTALWFVIAVLVAAGLRYETLFLLPPAGWLLWRTGRRQLAIGTIIAGVMPALVLGIVYSSHGAMFLPNSVLLKGVDIDKGFIGHASRLLRQLDEPSRLMLLSLAVIQLFDIVRRGEKAVLAKCAPSLVFIFALLAHAALARPDRRYLGYLIAAGIWVVVPAIRNWGEQAWGALQKTESPSRRRMLKTAFAAAVVTSFIPFTEPILDVERLPKLGGDIYAQQVQMARFLGTYYSGERVGLNDVGTTAWSAKNKILDFWGLANDEVAKLRLQGELTPDRMYRLAAEKQVRVVAIYSHWFLRGNGLPEQWQVVGRWQIPADLQVNAASNTVDFFATTPDAVEPLRRNLQAFGSQLPAYVKLIL